MLTVTREVYSCNAINSKTGKPFKPSLRTYVRCSVTNERWGAFTSTKAAQRFITRLTKP